MSDNETNEYPVMVYASGDPALAYLIVQDADEEKDAKKKGFRRVKSLEQLEAERVAAEQAAAQAEAARIQAEKDEAERIEREKSGNQGGSR